MKRYIFICIGVAILVLVIMLGLAEKRQTPTKTTQSIPIATKNITYLPLGDSYTIGQGVGESERWPNQLVARLQKDNKQITISRNLAVTGYTSQNVIDYELPLVKQIKPDFVSVQIGVNDYIQGVSATVFQNNLTFSESYLLRLDR